MRGIDELCIKIAAIPASYTYENAQKLKGIIEDCLKQQNISTAAEAGLARNNIVFLVFRYMLTADQHYDLSFFKDLIDLAPAIVNMRDEYGRRLIQLALAKDCPHIQELLIWAGAHYEPSWLGKKRAQSIYFSNLAKAVNNYMPVANERYVRDQNGKLRANPLGILKVDGLRELLFSFLLQTKPGTPPANNVSFRNRRIKLDGIDIKHLTKHEFTYSQIAQAFELTFGAVYSGASVTPFYFLNPPELNEYIKNKLC